MFSLHGKIALITLAFLAIAGIGLFAPSDGDSGKPSTTINVGIDHQLPLTIAISLTEGTKQSLIDVDLTSQEAVSLTVPAEWKRTEVRRSPLSSVTSAAAPDSTLRWKLPAGAGISYSSLEPASDITLHNPSGATVKIQLTRVNLAKKTSVYDVYLLQEGSLRLP